MARPEKQPDRGQHRIGTTFTDVELTEMDDWGFAQKIRNRSEVIRRLVRKGLEAEKVATTGPKFGDQNPVDARNNNPQEMTDAESI